MEMWSPVPCFEDRYEASNQGRIRSIDRTFRNRRYPSRIMKQQIGHTGYFYFVAQKDGSTKTLKTHRVVAQIFCENSDNKPHVNHIDGVKTNNNSSNLEWVTPKENAVHAVTNGLFVAPRGGDSKASTLTNEQADMVRREILRGVTQLELANRLSVNKSTIQEIRSGKTYLNASSHEIIERCMQSKKDKKLHHAYRVTDEQVAEIIAHLMRGVSVSETARLSGVKRNLVSCINRGSKRTDVSPPCGTRPPYLRNNSVMSALNRHRGA